jgi:hypothetical protein
MKTSSCKAKARNLQQKVRDLFIKKFNLNLDDVVSTPMSVNGSDIQLSTAAKKVIPFDIECKNQEKINIWESLKQCETNTKDGRIALLAFKRNRTDIYACLKLEDLLKIMKEK